MSAWIASHSELVWWMVALSAFAFVATLAVIPVLIVRMPSDYFAHGLRPEPIRSRRRPVLRSLAFLGRNLLGVALILAGIAMLVLPGQGLLTLLLGLVLSDFPGKYALERWLVTRPPVLAAIGRMRARAGRAPLEIDDHGKVGEHE